jgi:hypothetical protein
MTKQQFRAAYRLRRADRALALASSASATDVQYEQARAWVEHALAATKALRLSWDERNHPAVNAAVEPIAKREPGLILDVLAELTDAYGSLFGEQLLGYDGRAGKQHAMRCIIEQRQTRAETAYWAQLTRAVLAAAGRA